MRACLCWAESLRFSSFISVLLAVVFVVISSAMGIYALFKGTTKNPRWLPDFTGDVSFFDLFTAVPVIVTAFTFHFNGKIDTSNVKINLCFHENNVILINKVTFVIYKKLETNSFHGLSMGWAWFRLQRLGRHQLN